MTLGLIQNCIANFSEAFNVIFYPYVGINCVAYAIGDKYAKIC